MVRVMNTNAPLSHRRISAIVLATGLGLFLSGCAEVTTTTTVAPTTVAPTTTTTTPWGPGPVPVPTRPLVFKLDMGGAVTSVSLTSNGHWLAVGGVYAALYNLTDPMTAGPVLNWGDDLHPNLSPLEATPTLSGDGNKIAVQITDVQDPYIVTAVNVYDLHTDGTATLNGSIAGSSSGIALSRTGEWLVTTPVGEDNHVNTWHYLDGEWKADHSVIGHLGDACDHVSVALANYDQPDGTHGVWTQQLVVGVGPSTGPGMEDPGEVKVFDITEGTMDITQELVHNTIGSVAVSTDGTVLATWGVAGAVYDIENKHLCHTFETAGQPDEYSTSAVPFALSRAGGLFAAASAMTGVTLFTVDVTTASCQLTEVANLDIQSVSAVAISADEESLAIVGFPSSTPESLGSSLVTPQLLVYNVPLLVAEGAKTAASVTLSV